MPTTDVPSLAREFYQQFLEASDKVAFLRGLVNSTPLTFETEWLEFKAYPYDQNDQKCDQKLKTLWATNLSAFGNTQGGVLIWGIGAKEVDKVDAAKAFELVPKPDELRTKLLRLHHRATNPPLSGVEVHAVTDDGEQGRGFVVCYIPQGRFVPYRAEFDINQYFIRVGDDSIVPNPVILRRLFFPQSLASIEVMVELRFELMQRANPPVRQFEYEVMLRNTGNATAHEMYIIIEDDLENRPASEGLKALSGWKTVSATGNKSSFTSMVPIHPGFSTPVASSYRWTGMPREGLDIKVWVYWRDAEHQVLRTTFAHENIRLMGGASNSINHACEIINGE